MVQRYETQFIIRIRLETVASASLKKSCKMGFEKNKLLTKLVNLKNMEKVTLLVIVRMVLRQPISEKMEVLKKQI
jgi:hypothetical protein